MAIKSPRPEVLKDAEGMKRILTEADAWISMGMHPNIASCYYVLNINMVPHLFIEYVDGGSLAEWIKTGRCRDMRTALSLAIQFCHGMEYTHAKGIIHRDIKPQNILITRNSLLKITDFGILLRKNTSGNGRENNAALTPATRDGTVGFRGTPAYASPEQLRSAHNIDAKSDIFSFGLCLWLMLCGRRPFKRNDLEQKIPLPTPAAGGRFPPRIEKLLIKAVAFDPARRHHDFTEIRHELNQIHLELFKVPCPYAELPCIDLRADSLNNHAVSLFELGKKDEAEKCLLETLELNDGLPEGLHNLILLRWKSGKVKAGRLYRQVEAAQKMLPNADIFLPLEDALKEEMRLDAAGKSNADRGTEVEFRLCLPPESLNVFREAQLHNSIRRNIKNHMKNNRAAACHDVLTTAWLNNGFRKDRVFSKAYDWLLGQGKTSTAIGCQRIMTLSGNKTPVTTLSHIPGSRSMIYGGPDGRLTLREISDRETSKSFAKKNVSIRAISVAPNGRHIAIGYEDGSITLIDCRDGHKISPHKHKAAIRAMSFSPDGKTLASGDGHGTIKLLDLESGRIGIYRQNDCAVTGISYFNKGHDLVSGSEDGRIYYWEEDSNECIKIVDAHTLPVVGLSSGNSYREFVSASTDGSIKAWERSTGRLIREFHPRTEAITSILMMADGRHAVSGSEDDIIKIWDVTTGECRLIIDGRGDGVRSLATGPKPGLFMAGFNDGSITLFMTIFTLEF